MATEPLQIVVPDLGDEVSEVEVVDILVAPGDRIEPEQPVLVLESDKASMDLPATHAGVVSRVEVAVGDKVSAGAVVLTLEATDGAGEEQAAPESDQSEEPSAPAEETEEQAATEPKATPESEPEPASAPEPDTPPPSDEPDEPAAAPAPASVIPGDVDERTGVLVLGAGPGGYTAAFRAADLGRPTTLVERFPTLGGVCLNVGCIPSKALLGTAETMVAATELAERGIAYKPPAVDFARLMAWKDEVVGKLTGGLAGLARRRKVNIVQGVAAFEGPNVVRVTAPDGDTRRIGFEQAIIATGTEPVRLDALPADDPRIVDSTGALALDAPPKRMLVIGGGIIGLEMACVYDALGSRITVVELAPELLPECDRDLVRPLQQRIEKRYQALRLGTRVDTVKSRGKRGLEVRFEGDDKGQMFDCILVAVGRRPIALDVAAAGVEFDTRGFIPVDASQRTNVPHIFAVGDITGPPLLAHRATHQGKVAAEVAAGHKSAFEASVIPSVAYTEPELAWVGVTETAARADHRPVEKAVFPWAASGRAISMGRGADGLTKLIFDPTTRRLLGAGIVGPHAGELIAEAALAIEMGADPEDIGLTIHPHPTLSETVNFAAEMVAGTITDLYVPRRRR